jgi:Rad3-related DNA helicase/serine/threonine protein kinase
MGEVELQQVGPYVVSGMLRETPTSVFYRAKLRKKDILIKWLRAPLTSAEAKEAFLVRCRQLKKLKNRNIVNTLDTNFDGDHGYLVIEHIAGESLRERLEAGSNVAPDEAKRVLSPIAGALHYAHVNNTLHGNLHPGNILFGPHNDLLLAEFSLALPGIDLALDDEDIALPYMAPEYLRGEPTFASDQYALAVIIYEWLCGKRPYEATERARLAQQQEHDALTAPRSLNEAISPTVEEVLLRALAYEPGERFQHTQAFADHYLSALMGFTVRTTAVTEQRPTTLLAPVPVPSATAFNAHTHRREEASNNKSVAINIDSTTPISSYETKIEQEPIHQAPQANTPTPMPTPERKQPIPIRRGMQEAILDSSSISDLLQGGAISASLPGYEERPAQVEMATVVAHSLSRNIPAILEAGTGTGKSLAYLVPIVRSGKVAIVSTANKALQEQLFYKDIPFVQQHVKQFEAALVKGVSNYVCLDRMEHENAYTQHYTKNRDFQRLLNMTQESSFDGDFETLGFQLPADIRAKVATDSDQCAWSKCNYFSDCYVRQMRERATKAQIIVVNHTLLLLDAALDGFLLPERDVIVLDEAHHLEEEATRSFTITIGPAQIQTLLAQRMLKDHSQMSLQDGAMKAAQEMWMRLEQIVQFGFKGRVNLDEPFEEGLRLATVIADLADSLRKQRPKDMPDKESQLYDKLLKRTTNLSENIRLVFSVADNKKFVYYIDRVEGSGGRGFVLQASAAPLDITDWLKERLFNKCNVICTSATLATIGNDPQHPGDKSPNFAYFRRRVGLDYSEQEDVLERILPLAFDYESNALLYTPRDLPEPAYGSGADEYMKAIAREMYRLVKLSRGRAFLLFSSRRMLERAYELISPHVPYPLLKQGDMTRMELTRRFRQEEGAVLFGLKSFWEGVDIAGDALSLVVIDKLPFDPPDDPVHEARVAIMKAAGENWFGTYVLPQAVLRLKQGLGRLLRTRDDRGVMAILDTRLHTKGYGKMVLNALPPARRTTNVRDVEQFFHTEDL